MRLLIASAAAFAAVAFAAPSFAQETVAPAPSSVGQAQARHLGLLQHLEELDVEGVVPQAGACQCQGASHKAKAKKVDPAKTDTSAQYTPPPATPPSTRPPDGPLRRSAGRSTLAQAASCARPRASRQKTHHDALIAPDRALRQCSGERDSDANKKSTYCPKGMRSDVTILRH